MLNSKETELLLERLCTKLGFCLARRERMRLQESPPENAEAFTDAVFLAEGMDPKIADRHLYRQVKAEVVSALRQSENYA